MQAACPRCGKWNTGPDGTLVACFACGTPVQIPHAAYAAPPGPGPDLGLQQRTSGLCIASLCLGISAFIPYLGIITGILAVVFGVKGGKEVDANPHMVSGKGMATTGLILGIIGAAIWLIALLIVVAATIYVLSTDPTATGSPTPNPSESS